MINLMKLFMPLKNIKLFCFYGISMNAVVIGFANEFLTTDFKQKAFVVQIPWVLKIFHILLFHRFLSYNQIFLLVIQ